MLMTGINTGRKSATSSEMGPTPRYRRRLIFKLLGIGARDESIRLLEIGSGDWRIRRGVLSALSAAPLPWVGAQPYGSGDLGAESADGGLPAT